MALGMLAVGAAWAGAPSELLPSEPELEVWGRCPAITWSASGSSPSGKVMLMSADRRGRWTLPMGPCAGTRTGLGGRIGATPVVMDEVGGWLLATALTGEECGRAYQLLDLATCRVSNVVEIESDSAVHAGSFAVGSGPPWSAGERPLSCLQACAIQFGGKPADYWCSTDADAVDHLAYLDGWGDDRRCSEPEPEDFVVGQTTRCAGEDCYASAWVADHGCAAVNHCFLR